MRLGNKIADSERAKKNITLHRSEYKKLYETHSRQVVYTFRPGGMLEIPDREAKFFLNKYDFLYTLEPKPVKQPSYEDMKINELRSIASRKKLSAGGSKQDIINRIKEK